MIQTERLFLKRYEAADAEAAFAFLGDAEAMRFTQAEPDLIACRNLLETHERQREKLGYAPWIIREAATHEVIGWGGLYDDPFDVGWGPEVAYKFAPAAWGQGYATELVRFILVSYAPQFALGRIRAFAHPSNEASNRVLMKCGFKQVEFVKDMNRWLYELEMIA